MPRRVKEVVEFNDYRSLGELISRLVALRERLPANSEAEMKLRGDDVFGRTLTIAYFREQTAEEIAFERNYESVAAAYARRMVA